MSLAIIEICFNSWSMRHGFSNMLIITDGSTLNISLLKAIVPGKLNVKLVWITRYLMENNIFPRVLR